MNTEHFLYPEDVINPGYYIFYNLKMHMKLSYIKYVSNYFGKGLCTDDLNTFYLNKDYKGYVLYQIELPEITKELEEYFKNILIIKNIIE